MLLWQTNCQPKCGNIKCEQSHIEKFHRVNRSFLLCHKANLFVCLDTAEKSVLVQFFFVLLSVHTCHVTSILKMWSLTSAKLQLTQYTRLHRTNACEQMKKRSNRRKIDIFEANLFRLVVDAMKHLLNKMIINNYKFQCGQLNTITKNMQPAQIVPINFLFFFNRSAWVHSMA